MAPCSDITLREAFDRSVREDGIFVARCTGGIRHAVCVSHHRISIDAGRRSFGEIRLAPIGKVPLAPNESLRRAVPTKVIALGAELA